VSTVKEYVQDELDSSQKKVTELLHLLIDLPEEVGALESDYVAIYGGWLILRDTTHKDLGAKIASLTDQTVIFKPVSRSRTAIFKDLGPFYKVDLDRPNPKCRKVRVRRLATETTLEICGDIPEGYELLEELDVQEG